MAYKNIEDQRLASRRHYELNKEAYIERNKKYRNEIRVFIQNIKEKQSCLDCDVSYPYYVMDFDHLENKLGGINFFASTGRIGALKKEIKKCEVVCANCHRIRTYQRSQKG